MKKILFPTSIAFMIMMLGSLNSKECSHCYEQYGNESYNYRILIPKKWKKSEINLDYKQMLLLSQSAYTEIVISATRPDQSDLSQWENWDQWYIKGIGRRLLRIIETKNVLIEKDIVGKVLLFEYIYRGKHVLQRVLIAKFGEYMIIIECRSSLGAFKNYIEIFDTVMGSLKTLR